MDRVGRVPVLAAGFLGASTETAPDVVAGIALVGILFVSAIVVTPLVCPWQEPTSLSAAVAGLLGSVRRPLASRYGT